MQHLPLGSRRLAILAGFLFASVLPLTAQNFGQINGLVTDPSGTPIPNAKISVKNLGSDAVREGVTQNNGSFSILSMLPAPYSLTVTANGFQTYVVQEFRLQGGKRVPSRST